MLQHERVDNLVDQPIDLKRDDLVGVAISPGIGLGLARGEDRWAIETTDPLAKLGELAASIGPRWVWWDADTATLVANAGLGIDRCWDVLVVHRLLNGGWRTSVGEAWAALHGLPLDTLPKMGQLGLLDAPADEGDHGDAVMPDGHLRPEWIIGGFAQSPDRLAQWAALALDAARLQDAIFETRPNSARCRSAARSESAAELLCAEMSATGLPIDEPAALDMIAASAGPRPSSWAHEDEIRAMRDAVVLDHLTPPREVNLRNPAQVKRMLELEGFDLPDTRAWRLEQLRETEPLIDALLTWRKAERIATTYGYRWLDEHVRGGRLRGSWSSADGAAGRMTASAGLHNLPLTMRSVVAAEDGYRLVRADLGQIEPRVLAAVSGDRALIEATQGNDLYLPISEKLGITRELAKLAVLGAMYGSTTGEAAGALAGLQKNYPVAMALLDRAAESGRRSEDIFTNGGRRVQMSADHPQDGNLDRAVSVAAGRGRFARNALIQGAAAEFFKVWAITVRRHARALDAQIVLCLHDEIVVHVPKDRAEQAALMINNALGEAAHYWSPEPDVRFVTDTQVIERWSEAK